MTAAERKELAAMVARMQAILTKDVPGVDADGGDGVAVADTKPRSEDFVDVARRKRRAIARRR